MALTKQELIAKVAASADVSQAQAKDVVDATFEAITTELKGGGEVAVSGFGKFSVSKRAAREGRNPATGDTIQIAASNGAKFSAAAALKKALN